MEIVYERTEKPKLICSRILFIIGLITVLESLRREQFDYVIFSALIFYFVLLISITEVKVQKNTVFIRRHLLCGILPINYKIDNECIGSVSPIEISIESDDDPYIFSDTLLSWLPVFIRPKVDSLLYKIYFKNGAGQEKTFRCKLTMEETTLIDKMLKKPNTS